MAVVTVTEKHHLTITFFDGEDQLVPFAGFTVEGFLPHQLPGLWERVEFEVPVGMMEGVERQGDLARILFCDHGLTADQVIELLEDF